MGPLIVKLAYFAYNKEPLVSLHRALCLGPLLAAMLSAWAAAARHMWHMCRHMCSRLPGHAGGCCRGAHMAGNDRPHFPSCQLSMQRCDCYITNCWPLNQVSSLPGRRSGTEARRQLRHCPAVPFLEEQASC